MKKKFILCLILLSTFFITIFSACSGESKKITIDKTSVTANIFETVTLNATVENITDQIEWSISDAAVATVDKGAVSALKAGTVTVTASAEGASASAEIIFTEIGRSELTIESDAKNLSLYVGDSVRINSYVKFNGNKVEGGKFIYESDNSSVITISESGVIGALNIGSANVKIKCVIKGVTLEEKSFRVSVIEGVELYSGAKNDSVTLYIHGGANNEFDTFYALSPKLIVRNQEVSDAVFTYSIDGSGIITRNNNIITAASCGSDFVNIACSYKGVNVEKRLLVNVIKPTIELMKNEEVVLGIKTKNELTVLGVSDKNDIEKLKVGGEPTTIDVVGDKFTFAGNVKDGLNSQISIETAESIFVLNADIYDYVASTKDELKEFGKRIKSDPFVSIALGANIDYQMGNFYEDSAFDATTTYKGLFDGRGYTIYNIRGNNGVFRGLSNATLKNVAFFNVVRNTWHGGGAIANETSGNNIIENVYVQVKFTVYTDPYLAGFANIGSGTFRNVIVLADFASNPNVYNGLCRSYVEAPLLDNCYVISRNSNGTMYGDVTNGLYTDVASFNKDINVFGYSFSADCWDVINGTIMFKTMKDIVDSTYTMQTEIEITNSETVFTGDSLQLNASVSEFVSFDLKEEYAGLAVKDGKLIVNGNCEQGTVTVVATWQHPIYGCVLNAEKTFNVNRINVVEIQDSVLVAKNRGDFLYDIGTYGIQTIAKIEFNNSEIDNYTFSSGNLTIPNSEFGALNSSVRLIAYSGISETYIISIPVEAVDYAIGTKAELTAFGVAIKTNPCVVAVLTANIDYQNGNFYDDCGFNNTVFYKGSFDGKGYTIYDIKARNGVFYGLRDCVIKNVGIKNLIRDTANGGGSIANEMYGHNVIENVYVQVRFTAYTGDYLAGMANICEGSFRNVVLEVDFASRGGAYNAWGKSYNTEPTLENCYAVSSNSNGKMYGNVTERLYTDLADFIADSPDLLQNFDQTYWTIDDGKLVFRSCI